MNFPLKELAAGASPDEVREQQNEIVRYLRANQLIDGTGITWVRSDNGVKPKLGTITATCSDPGPGFDIEITD